LTRRPHTRLPRKSQYAQLVQILTSRQYPLTSTPSRHNHLMLSYPQHHHRLTRFISDTHLHIPATLVSENHLTTTNTITHDIETGSPRDVTGSTIPSAPLPYLFSPAPFIYCLLFAPSFQALSLTRSLVLPFIYLTACIGYKILFLIALRLTYLILLIAWTLLHSWHTLRLDINFIYTGFHKYSTYKPYTCDLRPTTDPDEYKMNFVSYITTEEDPIHKVTGLRIKRQDLHNEPSEISYLDGHQGMAFPHPSDLSFVGDNDEFEPDEDIILLPHFSSFEDSADIFTAYKTVDKKIKPVSGTFPESARVQRQFPHEPLDGLRELSRQPPDFSPTNHMTQERMNSLDINKEGFLWPEEEKLFQQVMAFNEEALAFEEVDRGTFSESYFSPYIIPTVPHVPWEYKNIPIPPGIRDKVIELLKHKMDAGVYEMSQSAYRSRWFCVLKKSGKLRIVHDLQPLNAITIRDAGLPPIIDDFVEPFAGRQCYTVFDLFWGFDARKMEPACRDLTAFLTPLGLLRITSLPTGFTNSPAEFQRCMLFILKDEIPHVANIFIDDLPIKGPALQYLTSEGTPETLIENPGIRRFIWEHAVDVNRIMHRIKRSGATFSPKKTQICLPEVVIVGQKCTPEGRLPDVDKVNKILNWPALTTPKEARGFLGLCGTVRNWIRNYSALAQPISELWRQKVDFIWDERRQEAFATLKKIVASAPALRPIDYQSDLPIILAVDTSYIAMGMVLLQVDEKGDRRPARYGSIPMNDRERRYSQPKLELYGLYRALRAWRLHLIGVKKLVVEVDAKYIKGMLNEPDLQPNAAINRWIQGILMSDFQLVHVPGTKHVAPDALSRRRVGEGEEIIEDEDEWLDDIALYAAKTESVQDRRFESLTYLSQITLGYHSEALPSYSFPATIRLDESLKEIYRFLTTLEAPASDSIQEQKRFIKRATQFYVQDGQMWKRRAENTPLLVIIDNKKRALILHQAHEELGHKGEQATYDTVRERFYWPHLRMDVKHHVQSCHPCQIRSTKKRVLPPTISMPVTIFTKVYVDCMVMTTTKEGYRYIVTARDDLTRAAEARALKNCNSSALRKFFWEQIYCRYGAIGQVVTDNGPEVKGAFTELMNQLNIPRVLISTYNKTANGVVERGNFTLREAIIKSCKVRTDWPKKVAIAVFADRISISGVTGFSAYYLLHGIHPVLSFDLAESTFFSQSFRSGMSTAELLALRIRQLSRHEEDIAAAAENLRNARFRSKEQFERRYRKRLATDIYQPGQLVLVRNLRIEMEHGRKTKPRYLGPYEVARKTKGGSYILKELDGHIRRQGCAAFRLLPYITRADTDILRMLARREAEENSDDDDDDYFDDKDDDAFQ
jgi:hypothetical protein